MSEEYFVDNISMSADDPLYPYTKLITQAMEEKGWSKFHIHPHTEEYPRDRIKISFNADNMNDTTVIISVDEDGRRISLYVYNIIKLPKAQPAELCHLLQTLHNSYIFARWVFDESDKTLQAEWYTHMLEDMESARIVADGVSRIANLVDETYPLVLRTCSELGMFQ